MEQNPGGWGAAGGEGWEQAWQSGRPPAHTRARVHACTRTRAPTHGTAAELQHPAGSQPGNSRSTEQEKQEWGAKGE